MRTKPIPFTQVSGSASVRADALSGAEERDDRPYCEAHGLMAHGADCWYCEECERLPDPDEVIASVLKRFEDNRERWQDRDDHYWFERLSQEVGELGSSICGNHDDPPDWELAQIASIALNWLMKRAEERNRK